jgi:hypothetical protein
LFEKINTNISETIANFTDVELENLLIELNSIVNKTFKIFGKLYQKLKQYTF